MEVTTNEWGDYTLSGLTHEERAELLANFNEWAPQSNLYTTLRITLGDVILELVPLIQGKVLGLYFTAPGVIVLQNISATIIRRHEISIDELMAFLDGSR